jgi:hypothetical protein
LSGSGRTGGNGGAGARGEILVIQFGAPELL